MKLPVYVYSATSVMVLAAIIAPVQAGDTVRLPSSFSYQGQIKQDGLPLTGLVDLKFSLHESPVTEFQIGSIHRADAVQVVNGLFDVQVDFGEEVFNGSAFWLEVRVRIPHDPSDAAPYITLDTRQAITATPYALRSLATEEVSWNDITDVPSGFADDVDHDTLGELTCADGQVPHSNGVDWACADLPVSTGDGHSLDAADGDPIDVVFVGNNGNVGIGTSTPAAPLHVKKAGSGMTPIHNASLVVESGSTNYLSMIAPDTATQGVFFGNPTEGPRASGIVYNVPIMPGGLQFLTGGAFNSPRMAIDVDGNVGIGTPFPTSKLHVNGDSELDGNVVVGGSITIPTTTRTLTTGSSGFALIDKTAYSAGIVIKAFGSLNRGLAIAPLYLPDGAVITQLSLDCHDEVTDHDIELAITRGGFGFFDGGGVLASVESRGSSGRQVKTTAAIADPTVDNDNFVYSLRVEFPRFSPSDSVTFGFRAARVKYEIRSPLP